MNLKRPSHAKINRFLHVTRKLDNGYHSLQTLFQFLNIKDVLEFSLRNDDKIVRIDDHSYSLPDDDLIIQAATRLARFSKKTTLPGVTIKLRKTIPPGSGMGGGSSNAATTLMALNKIWHLHLTQTELEKMATSLGADVPIFIRGKASLATGIGEIFYPVEIEERWFCIIMPSVNVSTQRVFSHPELICNAKTMHLKEYDEASWKNTLEPTVRKLYPEVDQAFYMLEKLGTPKLNGSGASIFIQCDSKQSAYAMLQQLPKHFHAMVTRSLNSI